MLKILNAISSKTKKESMTLPVLLWGSWGIILLIQAFLAQTKAECVLYGFWSVPLLLIGVWNFGKPVGFLFSGLNFASGILFGVSLPGSWLYAVLAAIYYMLLSLYLTEKVCELKKVDVISGDPDRKKDELIKEKLMEKNELIRTLLRAIDAKDSYTYLHSTRVSNYAASIAKHMKLPKKEVEDIFMSGMLHDIGKIGVKESILHKASRLDEFEMQEILDHPGIGAHIAGNLEYLTGVLPGIHYHHERYDGSGYPEGLKGEEIPLQARILAVADAFDAMTSKRVYRPALPFEDAVKELVRNIGSQFDPEVVLALVELVKNKGV